MTEIADVFNEYGSVIEYLERYTNKVAISNHRIIKIKDAKVTFKFKNYSDDSKTKHMTIISNNDNKSNDNSWQNLLFRLTGKDLTVCPEWPLLKV